MEEYAKVAIVRTTFSLEFTNSQQAEEYRNFIENDLSCFSFLTVYHLFPHFLSFPSFPLFHFPFPREKEFGSSLRQVREGSLVLCGMSEGHGGKVNGSQVATSGLRISNVREGDARGQKSADRDCVTGSCQACSTPA